MPDTYKITRNSKGQQYYTLTKNGKFIGNYDTVKEAADDLETIVSEEKKKAENSTVWSVWSTPTHI